MDRVRRPSPATPSGVKPSGRLDIEGGCFDLGSKRPFFFRHADLGRSGRDTLGSWGSVDLIKIVHLQTVPLLPITLTPNRRQFLNVSVATLAARSLSGRDVLGNDVLGGDGPLDRSAWDCHGPLAILSDTHICGDAAKRHRGVVMADRLRRVVDDVNRALGKPGDVIINGDCAFLEGQASDYRTLGVLLLPLVKAGHTIHLMMGNHDDREQCAAVLKDLKGPEDLDPANQTVAGKHVLRLCHQHADFYLLDTLDLVNHVAGRLGDEQIQWLDGELASRPDHPAMVIGHHNIQFETSLLKRVTGLRDSESFEQVLEKHPQVVGYLYGHNHQWTQGQTTGGCPTINLPTTAYVFDPAEPQGWVLLTPRKSQTDLVLRTLDPDDRRHGETKTLSHRLAANRQPKPTSR